MKLTKEQAVELYDAWYKAEGHHEEMESVVTAWESIRPPCTDCRAVKVEPTAEEMEEAEINAAWTEAKWLMGFPVFKSGWKAARAGR